MSDVVLTSATRSSLLAAQGTAELMAQTQERLATGKKVNSALDNPVNFFMASGLDSRAGDLSALLDAVGNGVQTIQAASTAITSIQKLVDSAKSTANQAVSDKSSVSTGTPATAAKLTANQAYTATGSTNSTGTKNFMNGGDASFSLAVAGVGTVNVAITKATLQNSVSDLSDVSASDMVTAINNQISASGLNGQVSATLSPDGRISFATSGTGTSKTLTLTNTGDGVTDIGFGGMASGTAAKAATQGTVTGLPFVGNFANSAKAVFTIGDGTKTANISLDATSTTDGSTALGNNPSIDDVAKAINYQISQNIAANQANVTAYASGGKLVLQANTAAGTTSTVTVTGAAGNSVDLGFGPATSGVLATGAGAAAVTAATPVGAVYTGKGSDAVGSTAVNANRQNLAQQFNDLLDQISQLANDASYNGVNLLNDKSATNKLHIAFNERDTANIDIHGQDATASGLALTKVTGGFQTDSEINDVVAKLGTATISLRSMASTLGSNLTVVQTRQDFTKNLINVLQTGSANLTNADLNEEAANSQALTTRQSLAISSLSLANQAQQGVLKLLQ